MKALNSDGTVRDCAHCVDRPGARWADFRGRRVWLCHRCANHGRAIERCAVAYTPAPNRLAMRRPSLLFEERQRLGIVSYGFHGPSDRARLLLSPT